MYRNRLGETPSGVSPIAMLGGRTLAVTKVHMKSIILRNGHLVLTGEESAEELREALLNLRKHTYMKCAKPGLGTPIESLLPDINVIIPKSTRPRNVRTLTVDLSGENL